MERVAWLEERLSLRPFEEEAIRPEIIRVALQWRISSKFTAFVCVDHSTVSNGERRHVVQPTEMPEAWEINEQMAGFSSPLQGGASAHLSAPIPMLRSMARASMPYLSPPVNHLAESDSPYDGPLPTPPLASMHMPMSTPPGTPRLRVALDGLLNIGKKGKQQPVTGESRAICPTPAPPPKNATPKDVAGWLARTQSADGSFDADVGRTAAALLALVILGNTRRKGDRRRTVQKAAEWLATRVSDSRAKLALDGLDEAEKNGCTPLAEWRILAREGIEGMELLGLLQVRGL